MLKKLIQIIPIGLSMFIVTLVLICAVFIKPEPVVPVQPVIVNNNVTPTPPIPAPPVVPPVVDDDLPEVDTSDWEVYSNEEYEFEIKYPGDWSVVTRGDYQVHFLDIENPGFATYSEPGEGNIFITMDKSQNSQDIHSQYFSKSTVIIDGNSAIRYEGIKGGHDKLNPSTIYTSVYLMKNDKKIEFYFSDRVSDKNDDKYIAIFNQMLSTFKFIEPISISDWKVYRNEKYGFELSFPSKWKDYKVDEKDNSIDFSLKRKNPLVFDDGHKEYYSSIFIIEIYSEKELQEIQLEEGPQPSYIIKNDNYVFAFWFCHDDVGFVGFPDYIPKEVYYGPIYDVKTKIIPIFKFIDP